MSRAFRIDSQEWRALFISNMQRLGEFIGGTNILTADQLAPLNDHMDRCKLLASAWSAACIAEANERGRGGGPRPTEPVTETAPVEAPQEPGREPVTAKRKGGWPKGKPRTRQKPRQIAE